MRTLQEATLEASVCTKCRLAQGRTQVVLLTKTRNEEAQRLFASLGFRPTMVEMTLDQDAGDPRE